MRHEELLIDGHFWGGPCDQSISKTVAVNPYTGRTIGTAAEASGSEARAAAQAAKHAFETFRKTDPSARASLLDAIANKIKDRAEDLADTLTAEVGKPITLARGEVARMEITFRLAAIEALRLADDPLDVSLDPRSRNTRVTARRFPIGPVLAITPYNWPFNLAAHKLAPALAAGCTVVVKGSPQASLCSLMLGRVLHESGVPAGVVNFIQCDVPTSRELIQMPEFAMISFTGSPQVGWQIKAAADPAKRITLELGGDAYGIVSESGDLDRAATELVESAFSYAGQICISAQHVLIHESIYDAARERFVAATERVKCGDPADPEVICGPLISSDAVDRVESLIEEALQGGARALVRGCRDGNVLSPTLLENVPSASTLAKEEAFGPVLTIEPYSSLSQAIAKINAGHYGIQTSLYTRDQREIEEAFEDLEVGGVVIGAPPSLRFDAMPYGGVKDSGFGREGVRYAMAEMTEWKTLIIRE